MSIIDEADFLRPYAGVIVVLLFGVMAGGCRSAGFEDAPDTAIVDADTTVTRIAFGSCLRNHSGGPILDHVVAFEPDLFIWLGDNVYIDTNDDLDRFSQRYDALGRNPRFQALCETCTNLAIWDDHDYGNDNVGISGLDQDHPHSGRSRDTGDFMQVGESYLKQNFGSIVIEWKRDATIRLQIRDSNGEVRSEQEINLNRLAVPRHQRDLP